MGESFLETWRRHGVRDAVVSLGVLLGLVGLVFVVPSRVTQLPGYVLLMSFVPVGGLVGDAGIWSAVLFGLYFVVLGVLGSGFAAVFRGRSGPSRVPGWRYGVAGGFAVTGVLAVTFTVRVLLGGASFVSALTSLATGLVLLGLAGVSAGVLQSSRSTA